MLELEIDYNYFYIENIKKIQSNENKELFDYYITIIFCDRIDTSSMLQLVRLEEEIKIYDGETKQIKKLTDSNNIYYIYNDIEYDNIEETIEKITEDHFEEKREETKNKLLGRSNF
jgi:hypothetical protein